MSEPNMVKPVPPKRPVCECGGGRVKVDVLIWGDLSQCAGAQRRSGVVREGGADGAEVSWGRSTSGNQKCWEGPNAGDWCFDVVLLVDVAVNAANPQSGQMMGRDR